MTQRIFLSSSDSVIQTVRQPISVSLNPNTHSLAPYHGLYLSIANVRLRNRWVRNDSSRLSRWAHMISHNWTSLDRRTCAFSRRLGMCASHLWPIVSSRLSIHSVCAVFVHASYRFDSASPLIMPRLSHWIGSD